MRHIAANAGAEGSIVVAKVKDMKQDEGFNAQTETYEDLVKAGVIDPAKVVRNALQNASSIASLLLTTEALVSEIPEEKKEAAGGGHSHGGGMGGMYQERYALLVPVFLGRLRRPGHLPSRDSVPWSQQAQKMSGTGTRTRRGGPSGPPLFFGTGGPNMPHTTQNPRLVRRSPPRA